MIVPGELHLPAQDDPRGRTRERRRQGPHLFCAHNPRLYMWRNPAQVTERLHPHIVTSLGFTPLWGCGVCALQRRSMVVPRSLPRLPLAMTDRPSLLPALR